MKKGVKHTKVLDMNLDMNESLQHNNEFVEEELEYVRRNSHNSNEPIE